MRAARTTRTIGAAAAAMCAAFVQQSAPAQQPAAEVGLQEVVVTAQKREENVQEVPISITAVGTEQIESRGISGLADLNALAPNVTFRSSPGAKLISVVSIRGSVTGQPAIWIDPPVGLYLNGVYLGKSQGSVFEVVDIERVEVLRGPQGTLFGRNTEGGAINIITRQPSGEFRGNVGVEAGNLDHRVVKASLDLPRFGIASVSLGVRKQERDGWTTNTNGRDFGLIDSEAARASLKLDFSDSFNAVYDFDYSNADNTPWVTSLIALDGWGGSFPSVFGAFLGTAIQNAAAPFVRTERPGVAATNGPDPYERMKSNAHALTLSYELNDQNQFKYIFATRSMKYADRSDIDGMSIDTVTAGPVTWGLSAFFNRRTDYDQDSHELQWVGTYGRFRPVVGLYYFKDDGQTLGAQSFSLFGNPPQRSDYASETDAKAVYAQADYDLTDRWTATLGIRYTEEEKKGWTHRYLTNGFDGPFISDLWPFTAYEEDFSGTTPMGALSFKPNENLNFYARVARGFKSGGFSSEIADPRVTTPYQPQFSVSTELGMKATLLDGRARLNVAVFNTDISDQQTTQLLPGTTQSLLVNVGESTYRGVELESAFLIADGWQMQLGYGYLDTEFDKFPDNPISCVTNAGGLRCTADSASTIDTASNRLAPYAPEHTVNFLLDGRLARGTWGELRAVLDATYYSKSYLYAVNKRLPAPGAGNQFNAGGQYVAALDGIPSQKNINARLLLAGIPAGLGTLDMSIWGRNITDEDDMIQGIDFSMFRTASWREPRTYMLTANYKW